jgi:hypothetical protein
MMTKKNILEKIRLSELSLVDNGANQHAAVTIFKRNSGELPDKDADILGATNPVNKGEAALTDKNVNVEEITKSLEDVTKKLEETQAALAEAQTISKMSDAEKAYMDKMDEKGRAAFMEMDEEKRKKKMDEMKKNDETITVDGKTVSKSAVGEAQFTTMKRLAAAEEAIAKANEATELARLEKRAAEELKHLPGTDTTKAKVLKALDAMADEEAAILKSALAKADEAASGDFETVGKSAGEKVDDDAAIEKAAAEIRKATPSLTAEQAFAKALEANPSLYKG